METGMFLKIANEAIQLYKASDRWAALYVDEWYNICNVSFSTVFVQLELCYLSINLQVWYEEEGPLFATKWAKNGVLWGGLGPKGPLFVTKWDKNGVLWGD